MVLSPWRHPTAVPAICVLLALAACSNTEHEPALPPIQAEGTLFSLLAHPESREVIQQREEVPVRQNLIKPRGHGAGDHGAYPAIEVAPPCEVRYRVPATHPDAVLRFATCVKYRGYQGPGQVHFDFELDGVPVHSESLSSSQDLPKEERRWCHAEFPIGAGGELVIRTRYEGVQEVAPSAGVGLLRVCVPFEVERLPAAPDEPNVLVILIDTLRADRLHVYGNEAPTSPVMDALAENGLRYESAYAPSAWTVPSTASVLTGMNPAEHGLGFTASAYLADSLITLAESFQHGGFTTGAFSCNPLIASSRNFDQGFEHFELYGWIDGTEIYDGIETWLRENADKRFFLYLHFVEPHYRYEPDPPFLEKFAGAPPEGYEDVELMHVMPDWYADPAADLQELLTIRDYQLKLYDAEIAEVDSVIGRLQKLLDELGIGQNTVVAVTSDHGEEFLEHGWGGHHNQLFDETTRVPLILAGPGIPVGEVRKERVENRHLGGTLLRLCRLEVPEGLDGPDLVQAEDAETLVKSPVFMTTGKGNWVDLETKSRVELGQFHSVIHDNWRMIWCPNVKGGEQFFALYDLEKDPDAHNDLAAGNPERVRMMTRLINNWIGESLKRRPELVPPMDETTKLLQGIGYVEVGGD